MTKINIKQLVLGVLLNALTIIVFILLYHAYFVAPKINSSPCDFLDKAALPDNTSTPTK